MNHIYMDRHMDMDWENIYVEFEFFWGEMVQWKLLHKYDDSQRRIPRPRGMRVPVIAVVVLAHHYVTREL